MAASQTLIAPMLPQFPKARRKMADIWNQAFFAGLHGADPVISEIPMRVQKEGDKAAWAGAEEVEFKKIKVSFSFPAKEAEGIMVQEFLEGAWSLGAQMAAQQAKHLFATLEEPTPHSRMLPWKLGEVSFDHLLQTWSEMQIEFGSDGLANWPTIVVSPEAHIELTEKMPVWLDDPECMKKWAALAEQKRAEWNERENRRKLVE